MNTTELRTYWNAAEEAARLGAVELEAWRTKFTVREKSRADLVTDADTASQKAIKDFLLSRFPDHAFLGEEEAVGRTIDTMRPTPDSGPLWVVDPLDGTGNYAHGVPQYCVNVALVVGGKPIVGVTLDPRLNELFSAAEGQGAFLNGQPIRVSSIPTIRDGLLSTGFPSNYQQQIRNLNTWARLSEHAQALRRTGSTAINMAYVACGRFDGYWCYDNWPWDVLPGAVLIQEAGGRLTDSVGSAFDPFRMDLIASNGRLHDELCKFLNEK